MTYKFDKDKYITCGIQAKVPQFIITMLWHYIIKHVERSADAGQDVDYLQVFKLSVNRADNTVTIKHTQEQPEYGTEYKITPLDSEAMPYDWNGVHGITIFVIDDISHATMLLSHEY